MTSFDERRDTFESKFAHDASLKFKAEARANKLLGQWAAGVLGLSEDQVDEYVRSVIKADFEEPGSEDVFRKLAGDLGDQVTEQEIRSKMEQFAQKAVEQIMNES
ncbi:MAG: DUF1476 domain-containing protein [Rhodobacteraceae bacterium]|nr:DUF1476 domain-containing protein [Paracoccaceae bacterium]